MWLGAFQCRLNGTHYSVLILLSKTPSAFPQWDRSTHSSQLHVFIPSQERAGRGGAHLRGYNHSNSIRQFWLDSPIHITFLCFTTLSGEGENRNKESFVRLSGEVRRKAEFSSGFDPRALNLSWYLLTWGVWSLSWQEADTPDQIMNLKPSEINSPARRNRPLTSPLLGSTKCHYDRIWCDQCVSYMWDGRIRRSWLAAWSHCAMSWIE